MIPAILAFLTLASALALAGIFLVRVRWLRNRIVWVRWRWALRPKFRQNHRSLGGLWCGRRPRSGQPLNAREFEAFLALKNDFYMLKPARPHKERRP